MLNIFEPAGLTRYGWGKQPDATDWNLRTRFHVQEESRSSRKPSRRLTQRMRRTWLGLALLTAVLTACTNDVVAPPGTGAAPRDRRPDSWRVIAESPLPAGYGYRGVWTGNEMLVWGGAHISTDGLRSIEHRDGAAYDPDADRWRMIPKAPIAGGMGYSLTWTGEEMLVWGDPDSGRSARGNRAAAYDPETNRWRRVPAGPLEGRSGHLAVWTGDELVVWGGHLTATQREDYANEGAAYDPSSDRWRRLPEAPLPEGYDTKGAWTGREVLVMTSPTGIEPHDYPKFDRFAAYDPKSDSWRDLRRPPHLSHVSPPITYVDGRLCVLSHSGPVAEGVAGQRRKYETGGVYEYETDRWFPHADPPPKPHQTWEQTAMGDEVVLDGLAYEPSTDTWRRLPEFPLREREFPVVVWTGNELIVWGGAKEALGNTIGDPPPPLDDGAAYTPPASRD